MYKLHLLKKVYCFVMIEANPLLLVFNSRMQIQAFFRGTEKGCKKEVEIEGNPVQTLYKHRKKVIQTPTTLLALKFL